MPLNKSAAFLNGWCAEIEIENAASNLTYIYLFSALFSTARGSHDTQNKNCECLLRRLNQKRRSILSIDALIRSLTLVNLTCIQFALALLCIINLCALCCLFFFSFFFYFSFLCVLCVFSALFSRLYDRVWLIIAHKIYTHTHFHAFNMATIVGVVSGGCARL